MLNNPKVGDVIEVTIKSFHDEYGIFVIMPNGIDALIHCRDMLWNNVTEARKNLNIGDKITAKVIFESSNGKLNLSMREQEVETKIESCAIVIGKVKQTNEHGLIISINGINAYAPFSELSSHNYIIGEEVKLFVLQNNIDEKNRRNIILSINPFHEIFAEKYKIGDNITCDIEGIIFINGHPLLTVSIDNIKIDISYKKLVEPYKSMVRENEVPNVNTLEFEYVKFDEMHNKIVLDMRPLEKKKNKENIDKLLSTIQLGDKLKAKILKVFTKGVLIELIGAGVKSTLSREDLSPNKVFQAGDEVFEGEEIEVIYCGQKEGELKLSRNSIVEDIYNEELYEMSLEDILATMDLNTTRFIGQVKVINNDYFLNDLISVSNDSLKSGRLLIDPINGRCINVLIDNRLRNFFDEGHFYEVNISLGNTNRRRSEGTPYMFVVLSNDIKEVEDPYKDSVELAFKQHTSPNTNSSIANLLDEVGINLYTSKKRMFFELLQNADDEASAKGVNVMLQITERYFILTHNGYAFNRHDFESITSAAKSTKSANNKKTGYKGIGFKSVFTNSEKVIIKSGGYTFSFDKGYPMYNNFKKFYFNVNDCEDDELKQKRFLIKFDKYYQNFGGVKDIPWQLLPIWYAKDEIESNNLIFNKRDNVAIALEMNSDKLEEYRTAIEEVFNMPHFMLFLRNTRRIQLIQDKKCLTIQKNIQGDVISLVDSFRKGSEHETYHLYQIESIRVDDESFRDAGIYIERKERRNNKGENENYFVRIDKEGKITSEVTGIPDRIASAADTRISFAIRLSIDKCIAPIKDSESSLYAYLPMNEHRFKFPFFINADFIPKSDREGVQSDNPWNHFLFYTIGKSIVPMIASFASEKETKYLNLLPTDFFDSSSQDTYALAESFNRGYLEGLNEVAYILNDKGEKVKADAIVVDNSKLSDYVIGEDFYTLIGMSKRLPHPIIESTCLSKKIFGIETLNKKEVVKILSDNLERTNSWVEVTTEEKRTKFYEWISSDDEMKPLCNDVFVLEFGGHWLSYNKILAESKAIVVTKKIIPIRDILEKLGFLCSNGVLEDHPLRDYFQKQDEKKIFEKILKVSVEALSLEERFRLFEGVSSTFDGVGLETLKKWKIFYNQNGNLSSLGEMTEYSEESVPWLQHYMINKQEYLLEYQMTLKKYLVSPDKIFSDIIERNIDSILLETSILNVYDVYTEEWTSSFTKELIRKGVKDIISVVEKSSDDVKKDYILSIKELKLSSNKDYTYDSLEYRVIKIAAPIETCAMYVRSIITIDDTSLYKISLMDVFHISIENRNHIFYISKILPERADTSTHDKLVAKFNKIPSYENIFQRKEANPRDIYNELCISISKKTNGDTITFSKSFKRQEIHLTSEQFYFIMLYYKSTGVNRFQGVLYQICIDAVLFIDTLDKCFKEGTGEILNEVFEYSYIFFPCTLRDRYVNCDNYTLENERVPDYVQLWANSDKKKKFLSVFGVKDEDSEEILRRKSFKENNIKDLWFFSDSQNAKNFLDWVIESMQLPIMDKNRIAILNNVCEKIKSGHWMLCSEDFKDVKELDGELYSKWKETKHMCIYVVNGKIPQRWIYEDKYIFKIDGEDEYIYFDKGDKEGWPSLYLTSEREPQSILKKVSKIYDIPFTEDDWGALFFVSVDIVERKDQEIAELKRKLANIANEDIEVSEHGKVLEKGPLSKEERIALNREARIEAKKYLGKFPDYDCSKWDPENSGQMVSDVILYKGEPITVVITSSRNNKLHLHPWAFAELMQKKENLLLNYGKDGVIHSLSFDDVFKDNPNVNLIFDMDIIDSKLMAELANQFKGTKKTCFVIENPQYSQYDIIKSFGLNEKKTDGEIIPTFDDDDIFNID